MFGSKIGAAIFGMCCLAVGLMLGLLVAALTDRSPTIEQNEPLKADAEPQPPPPNPDPRTQTPVDWGLLRTIPERLGPGTPFHRFATRLHAAGAWHSQNHWSIDCILGEPSYAHLDMFVPGEGKILIECVVGTGIPGETVEDLVTTLLFRPGQVADLDQAASHLHRRVLAVGKARKLTDAEQRRLKVFLNCICLARRRSIHRGMLVTVAPMPDRIRRQFAESLEFYAEKLSVGSAFTYDPPAVGSELGKQHVVELVFAATETSGVYGDTVNYHKPGVWWSLEIGDKGNAVFTSAKGATKVAGGHRGPSWPRLTIAEIDAMMGDLGVPASKVIDQKLFADMMAAGEQPTDKQPTKNLLQWVPVKSWQVNGSKTTDTFSIDSRKWRISWSTTDFLSIGGYSEDGEIVTGIDSKSDDSSIVHEGPGVYYLDISSHEPAEVWVEEIGTPSMKPSADKPAETKPRFTEPPW